MSGLLDPSAHYVYVIERADGAPWYIGIGRGARIDHHLSDARRGSFYRTDKSRGEILTQWLQEGFVPPIYKVAEDLTRQQALDYERILVWWYGRIDLGTGTLSNRASGGAAGRSMPSASLSAKRSAYAKARMADPVRRQKFLVARSRQNITEETRGRLKAAAIARSARPDYIKKLSIALSGRQVGDATRAKISNARRGRKLSAEHRKALSMKRRGEAHPNAKITAEIVRLIRAEYVPGVKGLQKAIRLKYGISKFHVNAIVRRNIWRHLDDGPSVVPHVVARSADGAASAERENIGTPS